MMITDVKEPRYFRFPVWVLRSKNCVDRVGEHEMRDIMDRIVYYCLADNALNAVRDSFDEDTISLIASDEAKRYGLTKAIDTFDKECLVVAAKMLNVRLQGIDFKKSLKSMLGGESDGGRCYAIIPVDLFWTAYRSWSFRDFAILSGVLAGIGSDIYKKLQHERIAALAAGYSSVKEAGQKVELLSRHKTRHTVEVLESQGWFVRCPANKRHVYYSKVLTFAELFEAIAKRNATKKPANFTMADRLKAVQELTAKIAATTSPLNRHKTDTTPPQHRHNAQQ